MRVRTRSLRAAVVLHLGYARLHKAKSLLVGHRHFAGGNRDEAVTILGSTEKALPRALKEGVWGRG